jgi:cell division protein FtsI/penicillin-binding protein 2
MTLQQIAGKTNRVLHIVLVAFLFIAFRVWHLGVVQREEKLREAQKPKLRTILMRADRGTICDRFHIPLATNRISYNAAVYYGQISQIPISSWASDEHGKRIKIYPRKEHVRKLAEVLGETLSLDPARIEDLIHSKASLLPHVPYILKSHLAEKEYYRLKMMEKDWLGIHAEIASERYYPLGKTGCHLIGTLGSIGQKEYSAIAQETAMLQEALDSFESQGFEATLPPGYNSFEEIHRRLYELKEKAYTLNDRIGKSGIEGRYEEELRGYRGLKTFEVDQKGKSLRELPGGKSPIPGRDIVLTISAELQQFAEELLAQSEREREGRSIGIDPADKMRKIQKQPWIKGGAIAALDPKTGEVLAFASHPRFDPNDFVSGQPKSLRRWLENEKYVASLWDGYDLLFRERKMGKKIAEEKVPLTWEFFLRQLLPPDGPLKSLFDRIDNVKTAVQLQDDQAALLYFSNHPEEGDPTPHARKLETVFHGIASPEDRRFAVDLCRLAAPSARFGDDLLAKAGSMKIAAYRDLNQAFLRFEKTAREEAFQEFHSREFPLWRTSHQKEFLAGKRKEEKEKNTYARPYIDYLDRKERELFDEFWEENKYSLFMKKLQEASSDPDQEALQKAVAALPDGLGEELLRSFRSFDDLEEGEKKLAASFYPRGGFGFNRSYAFQTGAPQGSLFKLIASYEALRQGVHFSLIDESRQDTGKNPIVAYGINQTPYPRLYKGGRLPRSSSSQIGKIDLIGAIEHSSNPFFSILAGDFFKNPEDLNDAARLFGLGEKTGIDLSGETAGNLPSDLKSNRTGLYAYAIGQHTLLTTPIQSALMLSALANGGRLFKPKVVKEAIGLSPVKEPFSQENRFAKRELDAIGIPYPLFTAVQSRTPHLSTDESAAEIRRLLPLPPSVRNPILEGMDRSVWSGKGSARPAAIKSLLANPLLMRDYLSLQHQMIGKTSTAEILFNPNANPSSKAQVYKHLWFGAISFDADPLAPSKVRWEHPELVVVVFLRFGDAGKEAAPIAAEMIRKWREIKKSHIEKS